MFFSVNYFFFRILILILSFLYLLNVFKIFLKNSINRLICVLKNSSGLLLQSRTHRPAKVSIFNLNPAFFKCNSLSHSHTPSLSICLRIFSVSVCVSEYFFLYIRIFVSMNLSLSLSLSLSHRHTHTHTHPLSVSLCIFSVSVCVSVYFFLCVRIFVSMNLSLSHTHNSHPLSVSLCISSVSVCVSVYFFLCVLIFVSMNLSLSLSIYIYIYIRSAYDKYPDVSGKGTFIHSAHRKTQVPFEVISSGYNALVVPFQQLLQGPMDVSVSVTFVTASFISSVVS